MSDLDRLAEKLDDRHRVLSDELHDAPVGDGTAIPSLMGAVRAIKEIADAIREVRKEAA